MVKLALTTLWPHFPSLWKPHSELSLRPSVQGDRVWLWEDEQYLPAAVSSCSGGVVVFATDYGQVSKTFLFPLQVGFDLPLGPNTPSLLGLVKNLMILLEVIWT